jgi:hypothetical protein
MPTVNENTWLEMTSQSQGVSVKECVLDTVVTEHGTDINGRLL